MLFIGIFDNIQHKELELLNERSSKIVDDMVALKFEKYSLNIYLAL